MDKASNQYLRSAILTATREQLQLMLYDGAIRFTKQGIHGIETSDFEEAFDGFTRAQKIILELINSLNYEADRPLCERMAGLYNFLYRRLVEASVRRDVTIAREALGLIEYQRQTWVMLMDQLARDRASQPVSAGDDSTAEPMAGEMYGPLSVQG